MNFNITLNFQKLEITEIEKCDIFLRLLCFLTSVQIPLFRPHNVA